MPMTRIHTHLSRYIRIFLLPALLLTLFCGADHLAAEDTFDSFGAHLSPAEKRYNLAKDYYYQLRRDKNIQDNRLNWVKGTREFRQIYLNDSKGQLAPNCLFMLGTMYYRMYLRFQFQEDIDEAVNYYSNVWLLFPDNSLADDAMYWTAEIYRSQLNNPGKAAQLYSKQIRLYPDGDKYSQAMNRLREIDASHQIKESDKIGLESAGENLVKVLPVQYWSSDDYTRIVIRASGPVTYTSKLLEKTGEQPRKLFIDFAHSSVEKKFTAPVRIQNGLLQQIKSVMVNGDTVRVGLDIESISNYKIFSLNDPFRVIVDVHGQQKILSSSKTLPKVMEERVRVAAKTEPPPTASIPTPVPEPAKTVENKERQPEQSEPFVVLSANKKRKPAPGASVEKQGTGNGLSLAQQLGLGVRRIVIDPGHGGKDPGAMGNGLKEKDITLKLARKTADVLRSRYDYEVILTRDEDRTLSLEERTAIANTRKADLFVSVHVNAHPDKSTRGIETFFLNLATNTDAMRVAALENATTTMNISDLQDILTDLMQNSKIQESSVLAEYVQNSLITGLRGSSYPTTDLGVKQAPFYVLIGAEMPSVLAEISFISNSKDAKRLRQDEYLDEVSRQIAAGISGYARHQATAALKL